MAVATLRICPVSHVAASPIACGKNRCSSLPVRHRAGIRSTSCIPVYRDDLWARHRLPSEKPSPQGSFVILYHRYVYQAAGKDPAIEQLFVIMSELSLHVILKAKYIKTISNIFFITAPYIKKFNIHGLLIIIRYRTVNVKGEILIRQGTDQYK